jgi:hypothetical protein
MSHIDCDRTLPFIADRRASIEPDGQSYGASPACIGTTIRTHRPQTVTIRASRRRIHCFDGTE